MLFFGGLFLFSGGSGFALLVLIDRGHLDAYLASGQKVRHGMKDLGLKAKWEKCNLIVCDSFLVKQ